MTPRIGFDHYSLSSRNYSAGETLDFARTHRFDGVQFLEPSSIDEALDANRLSEFRRRADAVGLYLEVGLPSPNPVRWSRAMGRAITPKEMAQSLEPQIDALAVLGCRHARLYFGDRHDRFQVDTAWQDQITETIGVLNRLTPCLKDHGIRLAIETHADLTVAELLGIVERLDPEVVGVTLDTGNLLMVLDDPLGAVEKLAPYVLATHIKDAVLAFTERGLSWQARPIGSGILPLPDMLSTILRAHPSIALSIELHPRIYDLPVNDPKWLGFFPDLCLDSLESVFRLAHNCERRYQEGSLQRPETVEATPWSTRDLDWLARSLGFLRSVVPTLIESTCDSFVTNPETLLDETSRA